MKNLKVIMIIGIIAVIGFAGAVWADPGTTDDPLVSKSYVDAQIASVKADAAGSYSVVHVSAEQSIIGTEGTEIVLRAGVATAIDNGVNGLADLTTGKEVMSGTELALNHLLLVPRNDGRGVKAWTEAYFMVKGSYTLK